MRRAHPPPAPPLPPLSAHAARRRTRDLFTLGGLRGTLVSLLHAAPSDFVAENIRSILHNTRTTAGVFAPDSPSVFTPN